MSVEHVRVGDVLTLRRRSVSVDPDRDYAEIGIRSFGRGIFHKDPVSGADLGTKRVFRIEPGDLVISNVFAWEGAIAVAAPTDEGRIGSHRFMTYVPKDRRIDTSWAAWFLGSDAGLGLIGQASPGSAGRNRTLAIDRFESLHIPLPLIEDQHRQTKYLNAVAQGARSAAESFTRHRSDDLIAVLPGLVDVAIGQETIGRVKVIDLADFVSDTVHPGDDPEAAESFVGLQHIESHTGRRLGSGEVGSMTGRKFRFGPGDVVYGYLRPYLNKVWVADRHGLCSVDQYVLRPRPGVNSDLLAHCLRGRETLRQAIDLTHNLQLPRLRSGLLASLELPTVRQGDASSLVGHLDLLRDRIVAAADLRRKQSVLAAALIPSAMNVAFAGLN
jgi:type I restriction enzyme, S subunit